MRELLTFLAIVVIGIGCKNSPNAYVDERKEVESFLDSYGKLLRSAKFDSVALLYVDTGFVSIGNGAMAIQNIDSIKAFYSRFPKVGNDFRWENTRIDILCNDIALVNAAFYWHDTGSPDTTKSSYTGVFLKTGKNWKIKNEHESIDAETFAGIIKKSLQN